MRDMAKCFFCEKETGRFHYCTLDLCMKCSFALGINSLKNKIAPEDVYLKSFVSEKESIYVDALNLYSTLFPKNLSRDLLGMANSGDAKIDAFFVYSMVIASRSVLFYGEGDHLIPEAKKIHALHVLGNLISVSMIGYLTNKYEKKLNMEDEKNIKKLCLDIDQSIIHFLKDMEAHDGMNQYIPQTIDLIIERF